MTNPIKHNCARSYEWTIAALEMGVKRKADVMCLQEPPRERGGCGISHSAYEIRKRRRVWTAIRKGSGLVVDELMHFSRGTHDDVIFTDVRRRVEKITRIVSVYDQRDTQSGERHAQPVHWQSVIRQGGTVLMGDFNAHSSRWDPGCRLLGRSD
jgi:endonuclease/exonuclease/phosphatase family metal-dependent hydrolase